MLCKNCGAEIHDKADVCVHCGTHTPNYVKAAAKKPFYKKWWFWVIVVFATLVVIGSTNGDADSKDSGSPTHDTAPQPIKISAEELHNAYEENEVAAEKKYDRQLVEITGVVDNIGTDIFDDVYVTLSTGELLKSVQCYFEGDEEIDKVASIVEGQKITVVGTCKGLSLTNVLVKECSITNIFSAETSNSQADADLQDEIIEISAADLFAAYDDNEVAADNKYKEKTLKITGTVTDISTDYSDQVYITLETNELLYSVQCYFEDDEQINKVAELKKHDTVTLIGTCEGKRFNVIVKYCEIM